LHKHKEIPRTHGTILQRHGPRFHPAKTDSRVSW
jgi:hypothetical protein